MTKARHSTQEPFRFFIPNWPAKYYFVAIEAVSNMTTQVYPHSLV
jgi:hypothetical protein